ncbi:MAG TPA: isoprenylcysteine carboxylmethyltransferase family protein [Candidatus Paceibacterota bacterium]|nr:isoprenylcysteine carboxylmethyltransferase family protein [Candidatus Paceibacterota bacterium]
MPIFDHLIFLFWLVFILYWLISAIGVKKNIRSREWARDAGIRILLIILIIILLQFSSFWRFFGYQSTESMQMIGVILCIAGLAFAIWARRHLGRNWSGTPSIKEGHELVTSGPYRFVRHPIYTGILLALIGSALASGVIWLVAFIVFSINFFYRLPVEERYMMQLFPGQYPEYKKRTKALIPFVW